MPVGKTKKQKIKIIIIIITIILYSNTYMPINIIHNTYLKRRTARLSL